MKNCENCPALQAIKDITHTLDMLEREKPEGTMLNRIALHLANDPGFLRDIAQKALRKMEDASPKVEAKKE